jgi:phage anti-repressor protein
MSFQAYLDNVEEKTGKTPNDFIAEAKKKNLTESKDIIAWLKKDYGLGLGHARAIDYVIRKGPKFEVRQTTGTHRDASGTLKLDGKAKRTSKKKSAR